MEATREDRGVIPVIRAAETDPFSLKVTNLRTEAHRGEWDEPYQAAWDDACIPRTLTLQAPKDKEPLGAACIPRNFLPASPCKAREAPKMLLISAQTLTLAPEDAVDLCKEAALGYLVPGAPRGACAQRSSPTLAHL